jgi:hypothetical protein
MIALVLGLGCAAPALDTFTTISIESDDSADAAHARWLSLMDGATSTLKVGLPAGEDPALADGLIAAWERGVAVEVFGDVDRADDVVFEAIDDAGVPLRLGDGPVGYFDFAINADVAWDSTQVNMTSAYVIADDEQFLIATDGGRTSPGGRVALVGRSEDLIDDLTDEHDQLFGGTDAATLTQFDGMAKSIGDPGWMYHTASDVILEVYFGPQERLTKRVIDAVYGARSGVRVLTDVLADEGLVTALIAKEQTGFDVEVTVGPGFGIDLSPAVDDLLGSLPVRQIAAGLVPTIVLVDFDVARDGRYHRPRAIILSQPLWSASRLADGVETTTDQYADAIGWILTDNDDPSAELLAAEAIVDQWRAAAVEIP